MRSTILAAWESDPAFRFWRGEPVTAPLQDLCDALYTLVLLDAVDGVAPTAPAAFARAVSNRRLAAGLSRSGADAEPANVHLTAYVLGTLALLAALGHDLHDEVLPGAGWRLGEIIDEATGRPRWPQAWSHHSWRVSHWVGGACSIIASLERAMPERLAQHTRHGGRAVLAAADALIDPRTGFLKCYRSDLLHRLFNAAYKLRHDPLAGEVGGVVHVHWVNHALGRSPFKGADGLYRAAMRLLERQPFIERTPYCLDFDVVQIARVAGPAQPDEALRKRAVRFAADLAAFFAQPRPDGYTLHRLPGALATWHECALIAGEAHVAGLDTPTVDIVKAAYWI